MPNEAVPGKRTQLAVTRIDQHGAWFESASGLVLLPAGELKEQVVPGALLSLFILGQPEEGLMCQSAHSPGPGWGICSSAGQENPASVDSF